MGRDIVIELLCHCEGGDNQWLQRRETITSQRRVLLRLDGFRLIASVKGVRAVRAYRAIQRVLPART
jgi:hypothetical protein